MEKKVTPFHQLNSSSQKPICLIGGGAGFIGSYLCENLLEQGCQAICLDNLLTGQKENLVNCLNHEDFIFIEHDLTKPLKEDFPKIDYVFHLAGIEAYLDKKGIALDILKVNAAGTNNLLELARKDKAKFLLVSSVDVYSAALSISSLKDYYQGSAENLSSHHEAKRFAESLVFEYFKKYKLNARIVRLSQVYGPRMSLEVGTRAVSLIKEAVAGEVLKIPGDGQAQYHPTFVSDVVAGLLRAMFITGSSGRIFSLADPEKTTLLSFAHELQRQSPHSLSIEFIAKEGEEKFPLDKKKLIATHEFLGWKPKVKLKEGIEMTLKNFVKEKKEISRSEDQGKLNRSLINRLSDSLSKRTAIISFPLFFFLIIILSPFFFFTFDCFWGVNRLGRAQEALVSARLESGAGYASSAQNSFERARKITNLLGWLLDRAGLEELKISTEKHLEIGQNLAGTTYHASLAAQTGGELAEIIFQNKEGEIQKLVGQIKSEVDLVYAGLSRVQAGLESKLDPPPLAGFLGLEETKEKLISYLPQARAHILEIDEGTEVLPELIALSGKSTYLVLFQNNMELRPAGGFIGSFGLVTFESGRFIDFEVHNVYVADGQLKGHVEPPPEIKKYLGEAGWYLRDSNFDPDFPSSATKAAWFLEKETGRTVDGVLAINLDLIEKILEVVGEIDLPDYQERITATNFYERAQYHAEIGFFPGSTQKEDFLGSLARALFEKAKSSPKSEWYQLGKAIYSGLSEKDFLVYHQELEVAKKMTKLGWDGSLSTPECQLPLTETKNCLADYLMIVEANFGVNKANFFIKRDLNHKVNLTAEGVIEESLRIVYQNESPSENFPGGRYKNYLRIYTPTGTSLKQVKIDEKILESEKIDIGSDSGKAVFGFLVEVPIQEKRKVEIVYQLAEKLKTAEAKASYLLLVQRQSGSSKDLFNFWLTYPPEMKPLRIFPQASSGPKTIFYQPKLDRDLLFGINFSPSPS